MDGVSLDECGCCYVGEVGVDIDVDGADGDL